MTQQKNTANNSRGPRECPLSGVYYSDTKQSTITGWSEVIYQTFAINTWENKEQSVTEDRLWVIGGAAAAVKLLAAWNELDLDALDGESVAAYIIKSVS